MLNSSIVKIGKLLYSDSSDMQECFWSQMNMRKKASIEDIAKFREAHEKDITKIQSIDHFGRL
jgi:hypothetical protein